MLRNYIRKRISTMKRLAAKDQAIGDKVVYMHGDAETYFLVEGLIVLRNGSPFVKLDRRRPYYNPFLQGSKYTMEAPEFVEWHEGFIKF